MQTTTMQTAVVLPPGGQPGAIPTMQNVVIMPQYVAAPPASAILTNYSSRSSLILGSTQIAIGILCILFNAIAIGTHAPEAVVGHGIWGGIFFILTGSFGIMASKQRTTCPIITFMVLSILSVVIFATSILIMASVGLGIENSHLGRSSRTVQTVNALLLTLSLIEAIVAIWSSALCCSAMCCGRSSGGIVMQTVPTTETMGGAQVLYTTAYPQGAYPQGTYPQGGNVIQQQGMQQQLFTVAPMTQVTQPTVAYPPQYTVNAAPPAYVQTVPYGEATAPYGGAPLPYGQALVPYGAACAGEPSAPAGGPTKVAL